VGLREKRANERFHFSYKSPKLDPSKNSVRKGVYLQVNESFSGSMATDMRTLKSCKSAYKVQPR
jgi:hypothetical protein